MRFQISIFLTITAFTLFLTGCPTSTPPANTNANAPLNTAKTNGNSDVFTPTTPTPAATTNDAPTLREVFKAYCFAKTKKDEAGLRKVYSQATLKQFEADMKADGVKTLVEYLEVDQVSDKLCEIRNEKIEGDAASAEIKTEGMPNGVRIKFVRENGEWKMTNEADMIKNVENSAKNSNIAPPSNTSK